jgi:hypothetical protein
MLIEQLDKTLAYHCGRSEDSDGDLVCRLCLIFYISSFARDGDDTEQGAT